MRFREGLAAALLFFGAFLESQAAIPQEKLPYLRWHLLEVEFPDESTLRTLSEEGIEVLPVQADGRVKIILSDPQVQALRRRGIRTRLLVEDYGWALAERNRKEAVLAAAGGFASGAMGGYYSPEEIAAFVDSLIARDKQGIISSRFEIGKSIWNSPLWMVEVTGPGGASDQKPQVFYNSLIHAREGMGLMTLLYFLQYIVENYGAVDSVTELVDSRELYFFPVVNPDGYEINWRQYRDYGSFGFWRKNARDNNLNGGIDYLDGVDLNRNFSYMWGYDLSGSSNDPQSDAYRGAKEFSEPETAAFRGFVDSISLSAALNFHSFGPYLINPFGYIDLLPPDSMLYQRLGALLTAENGYSYGNVAHTLGIQGYNYRVNGECTDWLYADTTGRGKIIAWALEVGTGSINADFWPPQSSIVRLSQENLALCFNLARIAGFWPRLDSLAVSCGKDDPSRITVTAGFSNIGISTSRDTVKLRLESIDPGLTALDSMIYLGNIEAGSPTVFPVDSLRLVFRENVYSAAAKLALYEGEKRLRIFQINFSRPVLVSYDLNHDSRINIFDLLDLLKILAHGLPPGRSVYDYDLNGDSTVDIFDLIALLKFLSRN